MITLILLFITVSPKPLIVLKCNSVDIVYRIHLTLKAEVLTKKGAFTNLSQVRDPDT